MLAVVPVASCVLYRLRAFRGLFAERGLPAAIRSDNGLPFASPNGLYNLSKLSVWWLRLGIVLERIRLGRPQENGRHERMHLTLRKEATRPPGKNILQQIDYPFYDRDALIEAVNFGPDQLTTLAIDYWTHPDFVPGFLP